MKKLASLCIFTACLVTGLNAQDISGTIEGTVLDPAGAAVPKAKISITNTDRNQVVRTLTTDATGIYSVPLLPIGNYSLKVEAAGFKTNEVTGIVLNVNDDLKFNVKLEVGVVSESVEVKTEVVAVELGTTANANTIEGTQVRELALSTRNYEQLMILVPGVTASPTDQLYIGNSSPAGTAATLPYSVNGNRNSANNFVRRVTDVGEFSPGAQVDHHFDLYSDITYGGKAVQSCKATKVVWADGTVSTY